jgi:hypothetical protein
MGSFYFPCKRVRTAKLPYIWCQTLTGFNLYLPGGVTGILFPRMSSFRDVDFEALPG